MKKTSTLGFGLLFSIASFAAMRPGTLTISADDQQSIKVSVDDESFLESSSGTAVFEHLEPGFHTVKIYAMNEGRFNRFHFQRHDMKLMYSGSVNIRPIYSTIISLNRFGNVQIDNQPADFFRVDHRHDGDRSGGRDAYSTDNDKNFGHDQYGDNYAARLTDEAFFAAGRVLDRETDNGRLLYAKRLADDNYLAAEQVKELARFFSSDDARYDFVTYAYSHTYDKNNFRTVCAAFQSAVGRNRVMQFLTTCE